MHHDVIVIGGSFAGLAAALQLVRARRRVLVIDAGKPRNRFATASHGFLGQDGRPPADILEDARRQFTAYPTATLLAGEARTAHATDEAFWVDLDDGLEATALRLVLATGVRDELPPVPGIDSRWGKGVAHCPYCHGYEVAGGELGVLGSSAGAFHQALLVSEWGPTTLFCQDGFALDDDQRSQLSARGVRVETSPVVEILGAAPSIQAVRLADGRKPALAALFVQPRTVAMSDIARQLGCAFDQGVTGSVIRVDELKRTTVAGVYAAGDAANAMTNVALAVATGTLAGVGAHQSLVMADQRAA